MSRIGDRGDETVVIAAPDRRVEEEMPRLLEAGERFQVPHPPLDVRMAGLPEIDLDAIGAKPGIGREQSRRLDVDDESRAFVQRRQIARQHDPDLVGENLLALVVDDAATVAVAVEPEREVGAALPHRRRHRVQHTHILGIRVVARKGEIEFAVERNDFDAERAQELGREGSGGAVAAGRDDLEAAAEFRPAGQIGDVAGRKIGDEFVPAARLRTIFARDNDIAQTRHLLRPEGHWPRRAHLDPGPAVVVMGGGHHRDRRRVERKLGEIGHRGEREPDVTHLRAARHQPRRQRQLDRGRIATEIVANHNLAPDAKLLQQARKAEPERLRAHEVDFLFEQPARIVFAKAGRFDHRLRFKGVGVGGEFGLGLGEQAGLAMKMRRAALGRRPGAGLEDPSERSNRRAWLALPTKLPGPKGERGVSAHCETAIRPNKVISISIHISYYLFG